MRAIVLSEDVYRDKVQACWAGKNIGGTLGAPYEGQKEAHGLTCYDPAPTEAAPNDDLELQLVWLRLLQDRGLWPGVGDFADYWQKYLRPYPWNEYGFCHRNLERGLRPPISGCFENYYVDEMGSPIRSEIWACVAPGDPGLAAALAWQDAVLDHAGGEGTWGEMFWAAVQSAAFVEEDPLALINIGLAMIPVWSNISRVVREAVWLHQHEVPWAEARERILESFGHFQPCNAMQNHGFTVMGWLYGEDFGGKLCAAVNCGYDTDCTGATLGATLGIIGGTAGIPAEWSAPIGEEIVVSPWIKDLQAAKTVEELTEQTVEVGRRMLAERSETAEIGERGRTPEDLLSLLFDNRQAQMAAARDPQSAIEVVEGYEVALHYGGEPVLRPGIAKAVGVSVRTQARPDVLLQVPVRMEAPEGCTVEEAAPALGQARFALRAGEAIEKGTITVQVGLPGGQRVVEYTVLGPDEAQGYPCGVNVEYCPRCNARAAGCVCECACE